MARPIRRGIPYFSMDTDIFADRKVRRVMGRCGMAAMTVILKLLCHIFGEEGYYALADSEFVFDIADELGCETALVEEVISACVSAGFFERGMYKKHGILTSARVQRNYAAATRKRVYSNEISDTYCLISGLSYRRAEKSGCRLLDAESGFQTSESDFQTSESDFQTSETAFQTSECTQSKVNQTKEKQSKQKHSVCPEGEKVSFAEFVYMTQAEHDALVARYGKDAADRMVEMLDDYKGAHGRQYQSDYRAIRAWVVRRYNEEQQRIQKAQGNAPRQSFERETGDYDHLFEDLFADEK